MNHSITQIATVFGRIGATPQEDEATRIKAVRNMTQRLPFPVTGRQGNADTFDTAIVSAMRLVQIGSEFGLGRAEMVYLSTALCAPDFLAPLAPVSGGFTRPTMAQTMLARVKAGEVFSIYMDRTATGQTMFRPGWTPHNPKGKAFADMVFESAGANPDVIATLEIKASRLIADLLRELGA